MLKGKKILLWMVLSFCLTAFGEQKQAFTEKEFPQLAQMTGWNSDLLLMHTQLYRGYVKNANLLQDKILQLSQEGKGDSYEFGALKRRLGWEFDGMRLHELYFDNLVSGSQGSPSKALQERIKQDFGSFEIWKQDFIATGLIRGIGWVVLYQDCITGKLCNAWINEHDVGHFVLGSALLVMDVFEHAYITQFGLEKRKYIDLFFQSIQWNCVNRRFALEVKEGPIEPSEKKSSPS